LLSILILSGKDKKKKNDNSEAYAVIAGTVFRSEGFAVGGAEIAATPTATDTTAGDNAKTLKTLKTTANERGEFAIRVPAVPMRYRVDVKLKGFGPQTKDVAIEGEQRKEVNFLLEASK
jgi:hypothetical protein